MAKTPCIKRSIVVDGRKTSVSLEAPFWDRFKSLADRRKVTLSDLAGDLKRARTGNLSSSIRVFVLEEIARM